METIRYKSKFNTQERIEQLAERLRQLYAQRDIAQKKAKSKRRAVPESEIVWNNDDTVSPIVNLSYFDPLKNSILLESISENLSLPSFAKIMAGLAETLNCHPSEICLLREDKATRLGKKVQVIYFNFTYNPEFNEVLKDTGDAYFDKGNKVWRVVGSTENRESIGDEMDAFFKFAIDLTTNKVFINPSDPESSARPSPSFQAMDLGIKFTKSQLFAAMCEARPTDGLIEQNIFISDSTEFVKMDSDCDYTTTAPFVLLRCAVIDGKPRYFLYNTAQAKVVDVCFGNETRQTQSWICEIRDTLREIGIPAFQVQEAKV